MLRLLADGISRFSRALAVAAGTVTALITLIICIEVGGRALMGGSVQGASEVAILLLVMLIFLGFAGAEANGENFSMTILTGALKQGPRQAAAFATNVISLCTVGLLTWLSWASAIQSTMAGEQSYGVIAFPVWPSRLIVAIGLTMLALQLLANIFYILSGKDSARD